MSPPFNMDKTYEHFKENAVPMDKWTKEENLSARFEELSLPMELYPSCYMELEAGGMLLMWVVGKDEVGYAIHKQSQT